MCAGTSQQMNSCTRTSRRCWKGAQRRWRYSTRPVAAMRSPLLLLLWDGICCYMEGRSKPAAWIDLVMRAAKKCSPEERNVAADVTYHSYVMRRRSAAVEGIKA